MKLVVELVAGSAGSRALGTACLDHKVGDDPVEFQSIIKAVAGQLLEVGTGLGGFVIMKFQPDRAFVRFDRRDFKSVSFLT